MTKSVLGKKSVKELRQLSGKIDKLSKKTWDYEEKKRTAYLDAIASSKRVQKLGKRIKYWIGKNKAQRCPAYSKNPDGQGGNCRVENPDGYHNTYSWLFRVWCSRCKLSKAEAMQKATFNSIFGKNAP